VPGCLRRAVPGRESTLNTLAAVWAARGDVVGIGPFADLAKTRTYARDHPTGIDRE